MFTQRRVLWCVKLCCPSSVLSLYWSMAGMNSNTANTELHRSWSHIFCFDHILPSLHTSFVFSKKPDAVWLTLLPPSDEGPPCTCPLCASDWSSCVPHSEGLQLSRDLGATYLELPSLNHVFVGRYFGSVVSEDAARKAAKSFGCPASDLTCVCFCAARVLHDSVSEAQSQREAREEAGKQSERAPPPSLRAARSEKRYAAWWWMLLLLRLACICVFSISISSIFVFASDLFHHRV